MNTKEFFELLGPSILEAYKDGKPFKPNGVMSCDEALDRFEKANVDGFDVYYALNTFVGRRSNEKVTSLRGIVQDDDHDFRGGYPLEPTITVTTSAGKYQRLWLFDEPVPSSQVDQWRGIQLRLTQDYGNDKAVADPARLLRLPGFVNQKAGRNSFLVTAEVTGRKYSWAEILQAFPPLESKPKSGKSGGNSQSDFNPEQAIEQILSGEDYHENINKLAFSYVDRMSPKRGQDIKSEIVSLMQAAFKGAQPRDKRWTERYEDIPRAVSTALDKKNKEDLLRQVDIYEPTLVEGTFSQHNWPPGFTGEFAQAIHAYMHFPNKQIAIASAMVIVAGVTGRKDSWRDTGPAFTLKLFAKSGVGKDTARVVLDRLIIEVRKRLDETELNVLTGVDRFQACHKPFGLQPVLRKCLASPSVLMILVEAGVNAKSNSGDQASIRAFLMQNQVAGPYTLLAANEYAEPIPPIYGVPITVLFESTKESVDFSDPNYFASGERNREFLIYAPHTADDGPYEVPLPDSIICKFKRLIVEACRGENLQHSFESKKTSYLAPCTLPVENEKRFTEQPEVARYIDKLHAEEKSRREKFDEHADSSLDWALSVRKRQLIQKLAFLFARTDSVVYDKPRVVTMEHILAAERFVDEDKRCTLANINDFKPDYDGLVNEICEFIARHRADNTVNYQKYNDKYFSFDDDIIMFGFLTAQPNAKHRTLAQSIGKTTNRDEKDVLYQALQYGHDKGVWQYHRSGNPENKIRKPYIIFRTGSAKRSAKPRG